MSQPCRIRGCRCYSDTLQAIHPEQIAGIDSFYLCRDDRLGLWRISSVTSAIPNRCGTSLPLVHFMARNEVKMTEIKFWRKPVVVLIGSAKYIVRNAHEAAWLLADKWPVMSGRSFMRALRACAASLEGKCSEAYARLALIAAARKAQLHVEAS